MYMRLGKRSTDMLLNPSLDDWDDEELARGYRKDRNGHFTGRPPSLVPTEIHKEFVRRKLAEAQHALAAALPQAIETLKAICESPFSDEKARIRAAELIIERVMGKSTEHINLTNNEDPPWLVALHAGIVDVPDESNAISANAVEVEGDDDLDDDIL
jgi:hypothetical protein